jgi:probable rRNA maturation factor
MSHKAYLHCDARYEKVFSGLTTVAVNVLSHEGVPPGELTIVLTDEHVIQQLNQQYLGHNTPTDVLSFTDGSLDPDTGSVYYGDVVIALSVAATQAEAAGHPLETELTLLTVHGVLHLLEYDHSTPEKRDRMWAVQSDILSNLGYQIILPEDTA